MKLRTLASFLIVGVVCLTIGSALQSEAGLHNKAPGVEYVKATADIVMPDFIASEVVYFVSPAEETPEQPASTDLLLTEKAKNNYLVPVKERRTENDVSLFIKQGNNKITTEPLADYRWKDLHRRIRAVV